VGGPMMCVEEVKACGNGDAECDEVEYKTEDTTMLEESSDSSGIRTVKYLFYVQLEPLEGGSEPVERSRSGEGEVHKAR
jgi:hypothetical protein